MRRVTRTVSFVWPTAITEKDLAKSGKGTLALCEGYPSHVHPMNISVITATRNRKHYLAAAIKSVQNSVLAPLTDVVFEHIVYDDASEDGTPEFFKKIGLTNVKYFRSEKQRGQSVSRNEAIKHASGEYIFILDDDDVILQRTLYNFARGALAHPSTRWFVTDFLRVDEELRYQLNDDYYGWEFDDPQQMLRSIFKGEHFIQNNVLFSKQLFDEVNGFEEKREIAEDLDLYIRFLFAGAQPLHMPFISHLHRYHHTNLSRGITAEHHRQSIAELRRKYGKEIESYPFLRG